MPDAEVIHISSQLVVDASNQAGILLSPNSPSALLLDVKEPQSNAESKPSAPMEALLRARAVLTTAEISQLQLSASVVVLSFGHSAFALSHSAEQTLEMQKNLKSLVDAFLVAGAKSCVVSLFQR